MDLRTPHILHDLRTSALAAIVALAPSASAQECGPEVVLAFTDSLTSPYTYEFRPELQGLQGTGLIGTQWTYSADIASTVVSADPTYGFGGPGTYLVCAQAMVMLPDQTTCQATHCELFLVPVDTACQELHAAFSISVVAGTITFFDQSTAPGTISGRSWDFGDGSSGAGDSLVHAFAGPGPYEVCLTVMSDGCSATVCNWVYFGPPDVACDVLLQPAFDAVRVGRTVAVFDRSILSGMNTHIAWDFGDGAQAEGLVALHTYDLPNDQYICSDVQLWGPLNTDTCRASVCNWVPGPTLTGVEEEAGHAPLRAFPSPFTEVLELRGSIVRGGARWELLDPSGRMLAHGRMDTDERFTPALPSLSPGPYLLRVSDGFSIATIRVVHR